MQKKSGDIVFKVVAKSDSKNSIRSAVKEFHLNVVKGKVKVDLEFCEMIQHDHGKNKYVVREV